MKFTLTKRCLAEFLGTAFLLAIIIGSGIMGERLAGGNAGIALLANTISTGAGLIFLILTFANISGAHFNPVVSLIEVFDKNLSLKDFVFYIFAQISGGIVGTVLANLMFELPLVLASTKIRSGNSQLLSEFIATFGLIAVILATAKFRPSITPFAVAAFITSAYWFTASTSFANPAVTIARSLSNTFAGIRPTDILPFILMQFIGAIIAYLIFKWLLKEKEWENE